MSSGSLPPKAAHDSETQHGGITRAGPHSEHNPSSHAPPIDKDNSGFTPNEDTGYNSEGSIIEKKDTAEQRRNATLNERNDRQSRPSSRGDRTPNTVPSSNIAQSSVISRRGEQPQNLIHRNDSGSPHAHNADQSRETHKLLPELPLTESPLDASGPTISGGHPPPYPVPAASPFPLAPNGDNEVFSSSDSTTAGRRGSTHINLHPVQSGHHSPPLSHSQTTVSTQPSRRLSPNTTNHQHKPQNTGSTHTRKRRGWSFIFRCDCIRA